MCKYHLSKCNVSKCKCNCSDSLVLMRRWESRACGEESRNGERGLGGEAEGEAGV